MPTDPICGMFVPETSKLKLSKEGRDYYFCSTDCLNKFKSPEEQIRAIKIRLLVAWVFAVPVLIITYIPSLNYRLLILLALALPVQFYSGLGFYEGAYQALKNRMGNMDILISLGTLTAFFYSLLITVYPGIIANSSPYYDASVFIITLILTGNFLESITKKSAGDAAGKLMSMLPKVAHKLVGDSIQDVAADSMLAGDLILIKPGEVIIADGKVKEGQGDIDTSTITGEQEPDFATKGDRVVSGTKNLNGTLTVEVERSGSDSTVNRIYDMLQAASSGRAKIQRIADIFSSYFVPVVLISASISAIVWSLVISNMGTGQWDIPVLAFVSVVVIACPCAIGLAAPIALLISSSFSYGNGLILKNTGALDRLSKVNRVIFDKTGTLTENTPAVKMVYSSIPENDLILMAASVENNSNHPVARSIVTYARAHNISISRADDVKEIPGTGISGKISGNTVEIVRSKALGSSSVDVIVNGEKAGQIDFQYEIKSEAKALITELKERGIRTALVTGDKAVEAKRIGELLSIDNIHSEAAPDSKAKIVMDYQEKGDYVLFVGDGINDTVAIETADAGIAVADASDIAKEVGDIILAKNDIMLVLSAIELSKETIRKVKQNIYWAIGYNSALIPIAAGVLVPIFGLQMYSVLPILAALAMGLSSTSVVLNSLLLRGRLRSNVFGRFGSAAA